MGASLQRLRAATSVDGLPITPYSARGILHQVCNMYTVDAIIKGVVAGFETGTYERGQQIVHG